MRAVPVVVILALTLAACGDNVRGNITIVADPAVIDPSWQPALAELVALTDDASLSLASAPTDAAFTITLGRRAELAPESYRIEQLGPTTLQVDANDVLGAQYGVSAALEDLGFRWRHPFDAFVPHLPVLHDVATAVHKPDIRVRGFQLHTLHPIEGYFAFWEPSAGASNDAHRVIDWVIKNRGNFLQWVALDDILDPDRHAAWKELTQEIIAYAHMRGIRVGIGVELFGQSNLQLAFDLSDDRSGMVPIAQEIANRLPYLVDGLPWDVLALSFGEFFNSDPQKFVDAVNEVRSQLRTLAPQAEMHADVHVGATQQVDYMGEHLLYYFLVKFADPSIVSDVHTVMFYDLFESAGGAYQHENFDEHRAYLQQRMCAGQRSAYFPETAYWVTFDNSIPQYLPIYANNRLLDLSMLQAGPASDPCYRLDEHLIFSSGWEWGYWFNDVVSLQASYERTERKTLHDDVAFEYGPAAADAITSLVALQRDGLMTHRLAGYMAGRDAVIDAGRTLNIISEPDRITFDQLVADPAKRAAFEPVRADLASYAAGYDAQVKTFAALDLADDRWSRELRDGVAMDRLRMHFVVETFEATLAHIAGDPRAATTHYASAKQLMTEARAIVTRRHADLHDPHGRRLLDRTPNRTFYQFGYLFMADTLCYWQRELDQVGTILGVVTTQPPSCVF